MLDEQSKHFLLLHAVCGYSQTEAFQLAFPENSATRGSCSAMASRLMCEPRMQNAVALLQKYYHLGLLTNFNEKAVKVSARPIK
jgi:hypothetical protein